MTKKDYIDLTNTYGFTIHGQTNIYSPESKSVWESYYTYATQYHQMTSDYQIRMKHFIEEENKIRKDLKSKGIKTITPELNKAHTIVTVMIYPLLTYFTNACLALELFFKSRIAYVRQYKDLSTANSQLRKEFGHDLNKLAKETRSDLKLTKKQLETIKQLNIMYSGVKRFQYPHKFQKGIVSVPSFEEIIELNKYIHAKIKENTKQS